MYRARVAEVGARPQEQYRFSVSQPCSTHEASFLFRTSVPLWPAHFSLPFAARIAAPARTCACAAHAPTTDDKRRDVRRAVRRRGWLEDCTRRSVRSPLRRLPLLATPIATPLQGGRPERSGLLFKLLNAYSSAIKLGAVRAGGHGPNLHKAVSAGRNKNLAGDHLLAAGRGPHVSRVVNR